MKTEQITVDFFASIRKQLFEEVKAQILSEIATELNQRRLTIPEASQYTGISEDTLYMLCREKSIPFYRAGSSKSRKPKIMFRVESLDRWMSQQEKVNCSGWE
ncbi:hypothetical protein BBD42_27050 [Paenibacillus sp. BIHB 4019]|uniref:Helix-turn-helix domain-containing protein n=1 Tax=Paenibacillus sp. BIHB 4019 TaxID=1870819 RepID=A0A1B2DPW0_9BACL|nr:helix-turn-helix domain-containing protein [Paenibacillus sp. BIHB 4019]ANY69742.1 hypothetical protein BBD42_27050 [Paenibacillus sp. BIHB 4019]